MPRSRAVQRLHEAPTSLCPGCGRDTKTVQGVCAECWHAKEDGAAMTAAPPRTERLGIFDFGLDWDDGLSLGAGVLALTAIAGLVVKVLFF